MVELLHNSNLLADLMLCAAELVDEGRVRRARDILVDAPELVEPVALVLAADGLDGLNMTQTKRGWSLRRMIEGKGGRGREKVPLPCPCQLLLQKYHAKKKN